MKKFEFPLTRVMEFRRSQTRLEEIKLEALYAELRAVDTRETTLTAQRDLSEKVLRAAISVTGFDLALFDSFRRASNEEQKRLEKTRIDCGKRVAAQLQLVTTKRREVKLLEMLKEKRLETWETEMEKEIDGQAEEAYLARWKPE